MRHRAFRFFLCLAAVCVAALWVSPSFAATAKDRYIKVVGVEGKVLNLDVDGKPVKIPLPEGYEVMQEKEFAKTYKYVTENQAKLGNILLCILVDSEGALERKKGINNDKYNVLSFIVVEYYKNQRFSKEEFAKEKLKIIETQEYSIEWVNSELQKKDLSSFANKKIFDDDFAISFLGTENYVNAREFRVAFTTTYMLADNIIIKCRIHKNIYENKEIDSIVNDTLNYLKNIRMGK